MWQETIQFEGPYNFDLVLSHLQDDPLNWVDKRTKTLKIPYYGDKPQVVTVQGVGTTDAPKFIVASEGPAPKDKVLQRVAHILQWDVSLHDIHEYFLKTDLRPIFEKHKGTPLILDFDLYACLVKCIIHQQLNMAFARKLTERFVHTYGFQQEGVWFYPSPEKIADIRIEELRQMQFSQRKAEYIIGVSKLIVTGELNLSDLAELSDDEIMKRMVKIRGIGPWTVENFLLFGLGRPNLFPKADIGIQNALKKLYNLERKPTYDEMDEYSRPWEPYLSYASLYLWRSIEATE
jgi:DNA-3-methyladenine glycosylase II